MQVDYSDEVLNGKNKRGVKCKHCNSIILKPEHATFLEHKFDLPTVKQNAQDSETSVEEVSAFWLVEDMFAFQNVGYSNTCGERKFLTCVDCEVGPIGYYDVHSKRSYVALSRVDHV